MQSSCKHIVWYEGKRKAGKVSISVTFLNILQGKEHKRTQNLFWGINMLTYP